MVNMAADNSASELRERPFILFNCREDELTRERLGFHSALARVATVHVAPVKRVGSVEVEMAGGNRIAASGITALWHLDPPVTPIPEGLPSSPFPTVWVHMDAGVTPGWRGLWSRLMDVACLCAWDGSGYDLKEQCAMVLQPYAARSEWLDAEEQDREFDIGWIGRLRGSICSRREHLVPQLAARYRMNPAWAGQVPEEEVLPTYRRAKIVVNIQRDDYRGWYNVRCFEALAAGALLFVEQPTELEAAGFRDGVHFAGYRSDGELFAKIDYYLARDEERRRIADAGRELVRREHTYDNRVAQLLGVMQEEARRPNPRNKPGAAEQSYIYCHYFCKRLGLAAARPHLMALLRRRSPLAIKALAYYARALWHRRGR